MIQWPEFKIPPINLWSMPRLRVSVESTHHFLCGYCDKWWSIGDAPARDYYCPWCGTKNKKD